MALLVEKLKAVRPLEAVAVSVIGLTPNVTGEAGVKVTDWLPAAIVNANAILPEPPLESVTVTVNEKLPPAVGVPESTPAVDSVSPAGKAPEVDPNERAPTPPDAAIDWL